MRRENVSARVNGINVLGDTHAHHANLAQTHMRACACRYLNLAKHAEWSNTRMISDGHAEHMDREWRILRKNVVPLLRRDTPIRSRCWEHSKDANQHCSVHLRATHLFRWWVW